MTMPAAPSRFVPRTPNFTVNPLTFDANAEYDVFVGTIGFETRSTHLLTLVGPNSNRVLLSAYNSRKSDQFYRNMEISLSLGSTPSMETDETFAADFGSRLNEAIGSDTELVRIAIDVSSCSRLRLAAMTREVARIQHRAIVDYLYVPGKFRSPTPESRALAVSGPVLPEFNGLGGPATSPITALLGLGFEDVEALGAFQLLEASSAWLFLPHDTDGDYVREVVSRNETLLSLVDPDSIVEYKVDSPAGLFQLLESAVYGARVDSRPVLVPLGPKLFALVCLLVSQRFDNEIPVWRFSSEQFGEFSDVEPSTKVIGLQVRPHP